MNITGDRIILAATLVAALAGLLFHSLNMRREANWNEFVHCRLMDLETGDTSHICKLN